MTKTTELKQIISENKNNIAFVIGNGIHNYLHSKHKTNYPCVTWNQLLIKLWKTFTNKDVPTYMISSNGINNISNTEFFNLLELEFISSIETGHKTYREQLNELSNYNKNLNISIISNDIEKVIEQHKYIEINDRIKILSENKSKIGDINRKSKDILNNFYGSLGIKYNINDLNGTLSAIASLLEILSDMRLFNFLSEPIKNHIAKFISKYKYTSEVTKIVSFIKNIDAPILTTNYDTVFSESIGIDYNDKQSFNSNTEDNWFSYYGNKIDNPSSGFGIWHMHGFHTYHKSISISATDYMKNVHRAESLLPKKELENTGLKENNWTGYNSWLNIFFNKNLFVLGLGLNTDETFLRWLLIKRAEYNILSREKLNSWYIVNENDELSCSKQYFLESVGFEIIKINDWSIVYENIWE